MGGGGHHHVKTPKLPDYRIYKVEDVPELVKLQKALAARGLKDPWLRNEVWMYLPENRGTLWTTFRKTAGRGIYVGFGLAVITAIVEKIVMKDDHGHHDGAHH